MRAVRAGDLEQVERMIAAGANLDETNSLGQSGLHVAATIENVRIAQVLLDAGASADGPPGPRWRSTPLMVAARAGHRDIVRLLVERGANVDANGMYTPLCMAVYANSLDVVEFLVGCGADVNLPIPFGSYAGRTPLMEAAVEGCAPIAAFLLSRGANENAADANGQTARSIAVSVGATEIVAILDRAGGASGDE